MEPVHLDLGRVVADPFDAAVEPLPYPYLSDRALHSSFPQHSGDMSDQTVSSTKKHSEQVCKVLGVSKEPDFFVFLNSSAEVMKDCQISDKDNIRSQIKIREREAVLKLGVQKPRSEFRSVPYFPRLFLLLLGRTLYLNPTVSYLHIFSRF